EGGPLGGGTRSRRSGAAVTRAARPPASPLVRRLAREQGVDLAGLVGSGPGGRVIRVDLERALAERAAPPIIGTDPITGSGALSEAAPTERPAASAAPGQAPALMGTDPITGGGGAPGGGRTASSTGAASDGRDSVARPLSQTRRVMARRLVASAQEIPVFTATVAVAVEPLLALRRELNQHLERLDRGRVSLNDLVVRAAALALREYPAVNSSWGEDHLLEHGRVNVGIAVATARGLVVPVVKDADRKTPAQIGGEARALAGLAADGKLTPEQMSGGTFTVSNLGMYGVEEFTAIINPPEAAILAVGAAAPEVALAEGVAVERQVMRLTLSADHRLIDGALGAQFLTAIRSLLETPWALLA
ncbi:MAG: 2-oxo acid dehydrogenase subunit E2, partial [Bifidobacteriaceae bacterium]|nr:2-oxo acid dehydrogenase subunit E2 [Bifidobacteriaceae bacterium]